MVRLKELEDGFTYIEVINSVACANIALQGAHIFHYARKGETPVLWLSDSSDFELGKAIRGGVPICWPSFGNNNTSLPQHGFARTSMFELVSHTEVDENTTELILELGQTAESLKLWRHKFTLVLKVRISDVLEMELKTINTGATEFKITQALHTYFNISDISKAIVTGLENKPRFDALTNKTFVQDGRIRFDEEFDSVFQDVKDTIYLEDGVRTITINAKGANSAIVWNPWIDKCKRMSGMKDEAYKEFVCIESANAFEDFRMIQQGESYTLEAVIQ